MNPNISIMFAAWFALGFTGSPPTYAIGQVGMRTVNPERQVGVNAMNPNICR